ncbi:hypothetical protein H0W91_00445 [Patescibacteria group bacterium]|nr:hypothetical protein [Patescibacteria group bacterium]
MFKYIAGTIFGLIIIAVCVGLWAKSLNPSLPPDSLEDSPEAIKWRQKYWKKHDWIPILVFLLMLHAMAWMTWPNSWMSIWQESGKFSLTKTIMILAFHAFAIIFFDILPEKKDSPWKYLVARIGVGLCFIGFLIVIGALPWFGEKYWEEKEKAEMVRVALTEAIRIEQQKPFEVTAPAYYILSERILTPEYTEVTTSGPIYVVTDRGDWIEYENNLTEKTILPYYTAGMRFTSRTFENEGEHKNVTVIVKRP